MGKNGRNGKTLPLPTQYQLAEILWLYKIF